MNVYDFDKTIYDGDSTLDFYFYCLKKQPILFFYVPYQILSFLLYKLKLIEKLKFKQDFYGFLKWVSSREEKVMQFWHQNERKIKSWYLNQQQSTDLVISASPEFLLKPICEKLQIKNLIASKVDLNTGECLSKNCYGQEKVKRFNQEYPTTNINEFYSDSLTDTPMAELAHESFFVKKDRIVRWHKQKELNENRIFINMEFFSFILVGIINTLNGVIFAYLFSKVLDGLLAFVLGYSLSLLVSYILNSLFVFKKKLSIIKMIKFTISYLPNFMVQFIMVLIFLNYFEWHKIIVYGLSAIVGVPVTFLILKFFTFK